MRMLSDAGSPENFVLPYCKGGETSLVNSDVRRMDVSSIEVDPNVLQFINTSSLPYLVFSLIAEWLALRTMDIQIGKKVE